MPRWEQRRWAADPTAYGGRAAKQAFSFLAYIPDEIQTQELALPSEVVAAVSAAERAVIGLNKDPPRIANLEAIARRLLRAESVASSRIEGLVLSQRRLAKAEVEGTANLDETAQSIVGNIRAMEEAVAVGAAPRPLTVDDVLALHRTLMQATNTPRFAGEVRREQNWIGGNSINPAHADFIPPPPEMVERLMEDLCVYMNREDLSPVVQAAVTHAQFETIHPFGDGNGRVGRALIHVVLRRRGLAERYVPPVSLVLAADSRRYVGGLTAFRAERPAEWIKIFADAVRMAADKAAGLATRIAALQEEWRARAGHPRSDSSAEALMVALPAHPVLTVATAQRIVKRSRQAANEAMGLLERSGVVKPTKLAKRNRAWEALELFDLVNEFERELATPDGDAEPARPAPAAPL
jgi:Fic family protein